MGESEQERERESNNMIFCFEFDSNGQVVITAHIYTSKFRKRLLEKEVN